MTHFKTAIALCGLPPKVATDFLDLSVSTISSYMQGRLKPSLQVWVTLNKLHEQIVKVIAVGIEAADHPGDESIQTSYSEALALLPEASHSVVKAQVHMAIVGRTLR